MHFYSPRKIRPWAVLSIAVKGLIYMLKHWYLLLLVAAFLSPVSPHVMVSYRFHEYGLRHDMMNCTYLGLRGFVETSPYGLCPAFAMIDRRKHQ